MKAKTMDSFIMIVMTMMITIILGPGRGEEVRQWLQEHKEVFVFLCDADVDDHNEHDHDQEMR